MSADKTDLFKERESEIKIELQEFKERFLSDFKERNYEGLFGIKGLQNNVLDMRLVPFEIKNTSLISNILITIRRIDYRKYSDVERLVDHWFKEYVECLIVLGDNRIPTIEDYGFEGEYASKFFECKEFIDIKTDLINNLEEIIKKDKYKGVGVRPKIL